MLMMHIVGCRNLFEVENLKEFLSSEFHIKNLGEPKKILWIEIFTDKITGVLYLAKRGTLRRLSNVSHG